MEENSHLCWQSFLYGWIARCVIWRSIRCESCTIYASHLCGIRFYTCFYTAFLFLYGISQDSISCTSIKPTSSTKSLNSSGLDISITWSTGESLGRTRCAFCSKAPPENRKQIIYCKTGHGPLRFHCGFRVLPGISPMAR